MRLSFLVCCCLSTCVFAQKPEPICITYDQYISKAYDEGAKKEKEEYGEINHYYTEQVYGEHNDEYYRRDFNFNHSKLDSVEINQLINTFIEHIGSKGNVPNYNSNLGLYLEGPGDHPITEESIKQVESGHYEQMCGYHLYGNHESTALTMANDTVFRNGEKWIYNNTLFVGIDTVYYEDPETFDMVPEAEEYNLNLHEVIIGLRFIEQWTFDIDKGTFNKDIRYLGLNYARHGEMDNFMGMAPLLVFEAGKPAEEPQQNHLVKEGVINDVMFDRFSSQSEKCFLLENAESRNYIEPNKRMALVLQLLTGVVNGKLKTYEAPWNASVIPDKRIKKKNFFELYARHDTIYIEDFVTEELVENAITEYTRLEEIVGLRFVEDWYLNPGTLAFTKKVRYIGLVQHELDDYGRVARLISKAYVKLN